MFFFFFNPGHRLFGKERKDIAAGYYHDWPGKWAWPQLASQPFFILYR